ncbi:MAG: flippase-like domain-containing protein [Bacteroidales bacterium]|nr:flippase-like domain-containing protein [Bacteroidales bacterium]
MKPKVSKALKYILSLVFATVLVYFSFRGVDWGHFKVVLSQADWMWIGVSMALGITAYFVRALRWHILLKPFDSTLGIGRVFNGVNIGYITNFVFPRAGEFTRCAVVSKGKVTYDKALATVVLERSIDVLCLFLLTLALLLCKWNRFGTFFSEHIFSSLKSKFALGWIVFAVLVVFASAVYLLYNFKDKNVVAAKIYGFFAGIWSGIKTCLCMERKGLFLFYTVVIWALYWAMSYTTILALSSISPLFGASDALFLAIAASLGWLVPAPGGIGSFHFIVALALSSVYALSWQDGIIFATLSHESQSITMVLCGLLSMLSLIISKDRKEKVSEL